MGQSLEEIGDKGDPLFPPYFIVYALHIPYAVAFWNDATKVPLRTESMAGAMSGIF